MENILSAIGKFAIVVLGVIWGHILPTLPFVAVCFFALILDCVTAFRLARRVKRKYPNKKVIDKFRSDKSWDVFPTLLIVYGCIFLGYMIDNLIFPFVTLYLHNMIAGGFCLWELWSILENESSENEKSWARFLQRFMVNKASRHIEDFKESWEQAMEGKDTPMPEYEKKQDESFGGEDAM